jgi:hypothetical protein
MSSMALHGRRAAALVACLVIVASCSADATPSGSTTPATGSTPAATASPSPSPSPSPIPLVEHCPGSDKTPGKTGRSLDDERSKNWAGYVIEDRQRRVSCVEGSWLQPAITCPATGQADVAIWVGIDGLNDPDGLIEAGDTLVQIGTDSGCDSGRHRAFAWYQVIPEDALSVHIPAISVDPGDRMRAMVRWADGTFTLQLLNATTGESFALERILGGTARQTAEWIVEAPTIDCPDHCRIAPLPGFDSVTFEETFASLGSARGDIDDDAWSHVRTELIGGTIVLASVSKLGGRGTSFVVTWHHS